jgi:hypothetical protein
MPAENAQHNAQTLTPDDRKRLNGQSKRILDALIAGPATNTYLASIALKYTSRISDLRAAGHNVVCERVGHGVTEYRLA